MRSNLQTFKQTLSSWGLGGRVQKTTIAVMLAWLLSKQLPSDLAHPYFAPLAALLASQSTIAESISAALQRVWGIVAGVILALLVANWLGDSVWSVGMIVVLSLALGFRLGLSQQGTAQVAVSALIVMSMGNADNLNFGIVRVLESVIGAVVGVAVNALIAPPQYVSNAHQSIQALAQQLKQQLEYLADQLADGTLEQQQAALLKQIQALQTPLNQAQTALSKAKTSLKYNHRKGAQQQQIQQQEQQFSRLQRSITELQTMGRILFESQQATAWPQAPTLHAEYAQLLRALAMQVLAIAENQHDAEQQARQQFIAIRYQVENKIPDLARVPSAVWIEFAAALASAERMSTDLLGPAITQAQKENHALSPSH